MVYICAPMIHLQDGSWKIYNNNLEWKTSWVKLYHWIEFVKGVAIMTQKFGGLLKEGESKVNIIYTAISFYGLIFLVLISF